MEKSQKISKGKKMSVWWLVVAVLILGIALIFSIVFYNQQLKENEQVRGDLGQCVGDVVKITNYCAGLNNMTVNELLKSFSEQEAKRIV